MTAKAGSGRFYRVILAYFLLFGVIVSFLTGFLHSRFRANDFANQLHEDAQKVADAQKEFIDIFIRNVGLTVHAVERSTTLTAFLQHPSVERKQALRELMKTIAAADKNIFQVRLLDRSGMELIRIDKDRTLSSPFVVPDRELQNKRERYYFRESVGGPPGTLWYSRFDLNIEHGTIEEPLRPTFRVAMPVYRRGALKGVLVVNVDMAEFLSGLRHNTIFDTYLIDGEGYFLYRSDGDASWSRYIGPKRTVHDDFPEDAARLLGNGDYADGRLFAYGLEAQFKNREKIKMILVPKESYLQRVRRYSDKLALYIGLAIILISIPMAALLAIGPNALQRKLNRLLQENMKYLDIIDRYVMTSTADLRGHTTKVSSAFCEVSGYNREELVGKRHHLLKNAEMPRALSRELWQTISAGKVWSGELQNRKKDGSHYWTKTTILPEYNAENKLCSFTAISHEITDKKLIEKLSQEDPLTKLGNRAMLDNALRRELARVRRYGAKLSVILLDLDFFKSINDTYGHQVGDDVLREVAAILSANTRGTDMIGRFGGEEFLIICPETTSENAARLAEKLRRAVEGNDFGPAGRQTASFGVGGCRDSDTEETLLKRADDALYQAKAEGRNRVVTG